MNTQEVVKHLISRDPKLLAVKELGNWPCRQLTKNLFQEFVRIIVSQQLQGIAAQTIFSRLGALPLLNKNLTVIDTSVINGNLYPFISISAFSGTPVIIPTVFDNTVQYYQIQLG